MVEVWIEPKAVLLVFEAPDRFANADGQRGEISVEIWPGRDRTSLLQLQLAFELDRLEVNMGISSS